MKWLATSVYGTGRILYGGGERATTLKTPWRVSHCHCSYWYSMQGVTSIQYRLGAILEDFQIACIIYVSVFYTYTILVFETLILLR